MTSNQQVILGILQGQEDPLTSKELSDISGLQQTVVLTALRELQLIHSIQKCTLGYKLTQDQVFIPASNDAQAVLKLLASDPKTRLPKTIRDLLDWPEERAKPIIRFLKNGEHLSMTEQGYYYLTLKGVELLQRSCPDFEVKPFVFEKIKNPAERFKIKPEQPSPREKGREEREERQQQKLTLNQIQMEQTTVLEQNPAVQQAIAISRLFKGDQGLPVLTDIPVKTRILTELSAAFGSEVKLHLDELSRFLGEYSTHEKAL